MAIQAPLGQRVCAITCKPDKKTNTVTVNIAYTSVGGKCAASQRSKAYSNIKQVQYTHYVNNVAPKTDLVDAPACLEKNWKQGINCDVCLPKKGVLRLACGMTGKGPAHPIRC